jgi:predicted nicotinamide N-methyase
LSLAPPDLAGFIVENTVLARAQLVPEIGLYLATEITPLWQATETFLAAHNMAPPFWAFAWPGSEILARYITDHREIVAGRRVLDFAAGCGLAGIAAAQAGACSVMAAEIDPLAGAAIGLNAALNDVEIEVFVGDIIGSDCRWDVILCGDVCYEAPMTRHILPWLRQMADEALVLLAEPGRAYAPKDGVDEVERYVVPVSLELEDRESREVVLGRLR